MKTYIISFISFALFLTIALSGCKTTSKNVQVIEVDAQSTNTVMQSGFNQKHYIWESWTISTNSYNEGVK